MSHLDEVAATLPKIRADAVEAMAARLRKAWVDCASVWIAGNGGSMANADHIANDLSKITTEGSGFQGLRAMSLGQKALMTAYANDVSYEASLSSVWRCYRSMDDVLLILSCSGESPNVVHLARQAFAYSDRVTILAITGPAPNTLFSIAHQTIAIPHGSFQVIEDCQLAIGHQLAMSLLDVWKREIS